MAANVQPIYELTPNMPMGQTIATANTAKDGTGTVVTAFTAGSNGSRVEGINFRPLGTNSTASVARIFANNGSTNATPANNSLIGELTLSTTTLSETGAIAGFFWTPPVPLFLPAGYKLNITVGTTGAAGWAIQSFGGDY